MNSQKSYMLRAIELAKRGIGAVNPNPLVGAVIVKDGRILSEDYHHRYGEFHAERNAILNCRRWCRFLPERMRQAQSRIFSLYYDKHSLCCPQIRNDTGR